MTQADVGDRQLEALFRDRFDPMVRLATLLCGDVHVAEEVVMDSFVRVAARLGDVEQPAAYLRTAVVNAVRSHHRRLRTQRDHAAAAPGTEPVADHEVDELWDRLSDLRPDERACVVLRYYEDLSTPQIAEALDLPLGTVKSHLHRAVATLRALIEAPTDADTDQERGRP